MTGPNEAPAKSPTVVPEVKVAPDELLLAASFRGGDGERTYEAGEVVELTGAGAREIMRRAQMNPDGVYRVTLTKQEGPNSWQLRAKYVDRESLLGGIGLFQGASGILAATHDLPDDGLHRSTTLAALTIYDRLRRAGRIPGDPLAHTS